MKLPDVVFSDVDVVICLENHVHDFRISSHFLFVSWVTGTFGSFITCLYPISYPNLPDLTRFTKRKVILQM